jgi:hypothetical protein
VLFVGEKGLYTNSIQEKGLLLPAVVTGPWSECGLSLVFVAEFDLVLDVVIDCFGVEFEKGEMISFELLVECLQIGLLELLPLVEKAVERLSA